MGLQKYIDHYRIILLNNLKEALPFDPADPYSNKNAYFEQISRETHVHLFGYHGLLPAAEQFYRAMVETILDYEQQHKKSFNKGIAYANLGVALISNANLDEGIHYLLLANKEDQAFQHDSHGVLKSILWKQFEDKYIIKHILQMNNNTNAGLHFHVDENFILGFLGRLELSNRLLLESTLWTIYRNIEFEHINSNDYTRGKLYSGLKDLCLLTESLLRKRQRQQGVISQKAQVTLGDLLKNALSGSNIGYPQTGIPAGAVSLQDFVNKIESVLNYNLTPELRRVHCLYLTRNFTGHHFDVSAHIYSPNGKSFFDLYDSIFINTVSSILYFAQLSLI